MLKIMTAHLYFQFQSNTTWQVVVFSLHFSDHEEFESSPHQYNHSGSINQSPLYVPSLALSPPTLTPTHRCLSHFSWATYISRWPASHCLKLQNHMPSCCHCHFLHVAHEYPNHPFQVPQAHTRPVPSPLCVDAFLMPLGF